MYSSALKQVLKDLSIKYAKDRKLKINTSYESAVIFNNIADSFHPKSYERIKKNSDWLKRLEKIHPNVKSALEMQSSNSSDSLLMNIFCQPEIIKWKSIQDLFALNSITDIQFGYNPKPPLLVYSKSEARPTEIDILINHEIICEAKLTEGDFQEAEINKVENYEGFKEVFDKVCLKLNNSKTKYLNYQLIRNILVAYKEDKRFILLCDMRRPDLAKEFFDTVICIKDINLRKRCQIIYWQDIVHNSGKEMKEFLGAKYGIE